MGTKTKTRRKPNRVQRVGGAGAGPERRTDLRNRTPNAPNATSGPSESLRRRLFNGFLVGTAVQFGKVTTDLVAENADKIVKALGRLIDEIWG